MVRVHLETHAEVQASQFEVLLAAVILGTTFIVLLLSLVPRPSRNRVQPHMMRDFDNSVHDEDEELREEGMPRRRGRGRGRRGRQRGRGTNVGEGREEQHEQQPGGGEQPMGEVEGEERGAEQHDSVDQPVEQVDGEGSGERRGGEEGRGRGRGRRGRGRGVAGRGIIQVGLALVHLHLACRPIVDDTQPTAFDVGHRNVPCPHCGALLWQDETSRTMCCHKGEALLHGNVDRCPSCD
jgi:hypothetical protein